MESFQIYLMSIVWPVTNQGFERSCPGNLKIVAAFRGMLVSPAKHSYASVTDRPMDGQTDRLLTKWSLCAAMLCRRHTNILFIDNPCIPCILTSNHIKYGAEVACGGSRGKTSASWPRTSTDLRNIWPRRRQTSSKCQTWPPARTSRVWLGIVPMTWSSTWPILSALVSVVSVILSILLKG